MCVGPPTTRRLACAASSGLAVSARATVTRADGSASRIPAAIASATWRVFPNMLS